VANSNLKKSVSKSRERLCDMKSLSLSKSRDYLNESTKLASRAQDKFCTFKTISKSQEVLSPALGGSMKVRVAGAVSDIPTHALPAAPRVYLDTQVPSSPSPYSWHLHSPFSSGGQLRLCDGARQQCADVSLRADVHLGGEELRVAAGGCEEGRGRRPRAEE
jgi:hypothetical protein